MATWGIYAVWFTPKQFPVAIPPKPAVHVEWPVIDCDANSRANSSGCSIPPMGSNMFSLKVKVKHLPKPEQGLFIAFYPERGSEDAKRNWYYGGAIFGPGSKKGDFWEFEGEASVATFRDQRMRAILQRPGEPDFAEVLVTVEPEDQN
jgi:hypothetical protein